MGRPWPRPGEPLFTEEDTEAALEWIRERDLKCPGCGQPRDESMAPENQNRYRAHPIRCHACAARERAAEQRRKQENDPSGLMWSVELIED